VGALAEPNASIQIEAAYQAVVEKYPDCPSIEHAYLKLAELYLRENAPSDAAYYLELYLERSWDDDPRVPDALYDLGGAYEQMGELELAAEAYTEFIEFEPHKDVARAQAVKEKLEEWNAAWGIIMGTEGEDK
jgi:TolA-binding protein